MEQRTDRTRLGPPPLPHGEEQLVIGAIANGSLNVEAALVGITGSCETASVQLRNVVAIEFDDDTRARLADLDRKATVHELCVVHAILGELLSEAALAVAKESDVPMSAVRCIGVRGHMLAYRPTVTSPVAWRGEAYGTGMQIGDISRVAVRTGVTTISNDPNADMAVGGNGWPRAPLLEYALYRDLTRNRAVASIGENAGLSFLPAGGRLESVVSFDTGPGLALVEGLAGDAEPGSDSAAHAGARAARGTVRRDLLNELVRDAFIQMAPPKVAQRGQYGPDAVLDLAERARTSQASADDAIATATMLIAESIAVNLERHALPAAAGPSRALDELIVGGRGAANETLLTMLGERLGCLVSSHERYGIPSGAVEAMGEALTAFETSIGHGNHAPWSSGGGSATLAGLVALGQLQAPPLQANSWRAAPDA